jgi:hypothetical protein
MSLEHSRMQISYRSARSGDQCHRSLTSEGSAERRECHDPFINSHVQLYAPGSGKLVGSNG